MSFDSLSPILDGLITAVFAINGDRKIIYANNAALQQFDSRLVGVDFVQAIRDPNCLKIIDKVLAGRKSAQGAVTLQKPVRTTYRINVLLIENKQRHEFDAGARAIVSLENVSHIYEAELMRSEFVANVSHELRSPLTALSGFIETLKGSAKNDKKAQKQFLGIMENEANRMNRLIGDLLSLSKVEANEHVRPDEQVDIVHLIKQAIEILAPMLASEEKNVNLEVENACQNHLVADEDQLIQVFMNLLENAIKYGKLKASITISVFNLPQTPGVRGPVIGIEFKDQSAGIAPKHLLRLTERFYRVDTGRSREKGGTGLGLAIVKHIIARHRGRLQITSKIDQGSKFTVFLPL